MDMFFKILWTLLTVLTPVLIVAVMADVMTGFKYRWLSPFIHVVTVLCTLIALAGASISILVDVWST